MASFEEDFLENYLKFGLGSMPKSDVDALVMHLLDLYGVDGSGPLAIHSNQTISERLKTPVSKVKKMRYDAALKFGGRKGCRVQKSSNEVCRWCSTCSWSVCS